MFTSEHTAKTFSLMGAVQQQQHQSTSMNTESSLRAAVGYTSPKRGGGRGAHQGQLMALLTKGAEDAGRVTPNRRLHSNEK